MKNIFCTKKSVSIFAIRTFSYIKYFCCFLWSKHYIESVFVVYFYCDIKYEKKSDSNVCGVCSGFCWNLIFLSSSDVYP